MFVQAEKICSSMGVYSSSSLQVTAAFHRFMLKKDGGPRRFTYRPGFGFPVRKLGTLNTPADCCMSSSPGE